MKRRVYYFIFTLILIIPCSAEDDVPFQMRRLSDRTIVITGGRNNGNTIVVASEKGLVLIDTNWSQYFAKKIKEMVKKEMGRDDFVYVINTHGHADHTGGNQMFPMAEIIGHVNCYEAMKQDQSTQQKWVEEMLTYVRSSLNRYNEQLDGLNGNSDEAQVIKQKRNIEKHLLDDYTHGFAITPPNIRFTDRLTLDMGDMTLKLIYYGEAHSNGDILIQVPEEGLLMTGDIGFDTYLAFGSDIQKKFNVPRWFEVLDEVLEAEIKYVVKGHDLIWTKKDLLARYGYIRELWLGIVNAKKEGYSLDEVLTHFDIDKKFAYVKQWKPRPWESDRDEETLLKRHRNLIKIFWNQPQSNN